MNLDIFGWVATACFASCYIPQLIKTFKTGKIRDVSLTQWVIQMVGYLTGVIYGIHLKQLPLIVGYIWGGTSTALFLIMYRHFAKRGKK